MIWLIALLLVWMAFEVRSDPERRQSQNFKITLWLAVGAIVCFGGESAAVTYASALTTRSTLAKLGNFASFLELIAWICLAAAVFFVFQKTNSEG
jgi:hypothetical protein